MSEYIKREDVYKTLKIVVNVDGCEPSITEIDMDAFEAIPADDVEPVVRGEWKESFTTRDCQCAPSGVSYTFWYTCSICGKKSRTKRERCLRCFSHMERSGSGE